VLEINSPIRRRCSRSERVRLQLPRLSKAGAIADAIMVALLMISSACGAAALTGPEDPIYPAPTAPLFDGTLFSVGVPGTSDIFRWRIARMSWQRGAHYQQQPSNRGLTEITWSGECEVPSSVTSYAVQLRLSDGPGTGLGEYFTPSLDSTFASPLSLRCRRDVKGSIGTRRAAVPYLQILLWVNRGEDPILTTGTFTVPPGRDVLRTGRLDCAAVDAAGTTGMI